VLTDMVTFFCHTMMFLYSFLFPINFVFLQVFLTDICVCFFAYISAELVALCISAISVFGKRLQ
jgi:hypothetical protein